MSEDKATPKNDENVQRAMRSVAIAEAVKADGGLSYDDNGNRICNPIQLIDCANVIYNFIKGA